MLGLPFIKLLTTLGAKALLRGRELGFRLRPAAALSTRFLIFNRFITRPTSVLIFSHKLLLI